MWAARTFVCTIIKPDPWWCYRLAHGSSVSGITAEPDHNDKMRCFSNSALALCRLDTLGGSHLLDVVASIDLSLVWPVLASLLEVVNAPAILLVNSALAAMAL